MIIRKGYWSCLRHWGRLISTIPLGGRLKSRSSNRIFTEGLGDASCCYHLVTKSRTIGDEYLELLLLFHILVKEVLICTQTGFGLGVCLALGDMRTTFKLPPKVLRLLVLPFSSSSSRFAFCSSHEV